MIWFLKDVFDMDNIKEDVIKIKVILVYILQNFILDLKGNLIKLRKILSKGYRVT